jgi:hypothetical protein
MESDVRQESRPPLDEDFEPQVQLRMKTDPNDGHFAQQGNPPPPPPPKGQPESYQTYLKRSKQLLDTLKDAPATKKKNHLGHEIAAKTNLPRQLLDYQPSQLNRTTMPKKGSEDMDGLALVEGIGGFPPPKPARGLRPKQTETVDIGKQGKRAVSMADTSRMDQMLILPSVNPLQKKGKGVNSMQTTAGKGKSTLGQKRSPVGSTRSGDDPEEDLTLASSLIGNLLDEIISQGEIDENNPIFMQFVQEIRKSNVLFAKLSPKTTVEILKNQRILIYNSQYVYRQAQKVQSSYLILFGRVVLSTQDNGPIKECLMGDTLSEEALVEKGPLGKQQESAKAIEKSGIIEINQAEYEQLRQVLHSRGLKSDFLILHSALSRNLVSKRVVREQYAS